VKRFILVTLAVLGLMVSFAGCANDATIARHNLEVAEQNFQVYRRCVFYNVITGDYILQVEGMIAIIVDEDKDLVVTVKTQDGQYLKHYFGHADNVTYFSQALASNAVSDKNYKIIFKPSAILPTIEGR
jgi:hypothetical protein